ncbi:MAG TPA: SufE family protein [Bacteroidia bacterium]|nr:SufE family protein [Bacteroidia bacterium]
MTIEEEEQEIIHEFEMFERWDDKYQYLIDLGKSLPPLNEKFMTDDRLIRGCQSRVWMQSELKNGKVYYYADSDAIITKGLVALMVRVLFGHSPKEIMEAPLTFIDKIGLKDHLSPTRSNGLLAMVKQMKLDALALSIKDKA